MAERTRAVLKTFFETGDFPTATQFADLIDSMNNKQDDGAPITFLPSAPATSSDTGAFGNMAFDADYLYVCVAVNTWRRMPISDW
jgi:hypothetical protein